MMSQDLERIAAALVAQGKGILAADETVPTLTECGSIRSAFRRPSKADAPTAKCSLPRRVRLSSSAASSCKMDHALEAWHGRDENLEAGRQALHLRGRCNSAASLGQYTPETEAIPVSVGTPPHRREWRDD
jgi:fructose-bisphosphate aldolase class 1